MKTLLRWMLVPLLAAVAAAESPSSAKKGKDTAKEKTDHQDASVQHLILGENPIAPDCSIRFDLSQDWARVPRKPTDDPGQARYRSGKGAGSIFCTVLVTKAFDGPAEQLTEAQATALVSPAKLRESLENSTNHVLEADSHPFAGKPGGRVVSDVTSSAPGPQPPLRSVAFATLDRNYLVIVSFVFHAGDPGAITLDDAQKAYMPTFEAIIKTASRVPRPDAKQPAAAPDEVARGLETLELQEVLKAGTEQSYWLDRIGREYPALHGETLAAAKAYEASVFGQASGSALARLGQLLGDNKLDAAKAAALRTATETHAKIPLTLDDATKRLAGIKANATTGPMGDVRAILLAMHPDFRNKPELEMTGGWTQHLTLADSLSLEDYKTGIDVPASWIKTVNHTDEPAVLFVSGYGHGPLTCAVRVRKALEAPLTDQEAAAIFTPAELKARTAGEKSVILESGSNEITGHPSGWLYTRSEGTAPAAARHTTTFLTFEGPYLIRIDLALFDVQIAPLSIEEARAKWQPTFEAILQSFRRDPRYMPDSPKDSQERTQARTFLENLEMLKIQSFTLDRIATSFPDFRERANTVKAAFAASPYGKSEEVMAAGLVRLQGDDFKATLDEKIKQWQDMIGQAPVSGISPAKYLDIVEGLARGGYPEKTRQTLAATNADFLAHPAAELTAGCTRSFSLAKDFKAPDGKATLSFPISWRSARTEKPAPESPILLFRSGDGFGPIVCMLRINKISSPANPTDEQTAAFLDPESVRKRQQDPTMKITGAVSHPIGGKPGVRILADASDPKGLKADMPTATYMTFAGPYLINASFHLDPVTGEPPSATRDTLLPLFDSILDTLVRE